MKMDLEEIVLVMKRLGKDISVYDEKFLAIALNKRLAKTGDTTSAAYAEYLWRNSNEAELFFESLHITYSEFFRNPLTFALLERLIFPTLITAKEKSGKKEIRIWSAGCAAGQEAYSIAILLDEMLSERGYPLSFRLFATDSFDSELTAARWGQYDSSALHNLRLRYLHKYFTNQGEAYSINEGLKARIDFSSHDLLDAGSSSPSASIYGDFDLIFCGNLLFYYRPEIRQFILNKTNQALAPGGYLATGEAEQGIVARHPGFRAVSPLAAVFQKTKETFNN